MAIRGDSTGRPTATGLNLWNILNTLAAEAERYPDPPAPRPHHLHKGVVWTNLMLSGSK